MPPARRSATARRPSTVASFRSFCKQCQGCNRNIGCQDASSSSSSPPPLPSPFVCGGTQIVRFLIAVSRQAGGTRGDKGFSMVLNTRILRACFYIAPLSSPSKIMPTPRESALRNRASPERNRKTFNQPSRDDERKSSVPACNDFSKSFATRISFAFSFKWSLEIRPFTEIRWMLTFPRELLSSVERLFRTHPSILRRARFNATRGAHRE
jgi:hypothetical protein